jgi:hypothetical protein
MCQVIDIEVTEGGPYNSTLDPLKRLISITQLSSGVGIDIRSPLSPLSYKPFIGHRIIECEDVGRIEKYIGGSVSLMI